MLNKRKQTRKVNLQKDCKPNKLFFPPLKVEKKKKEKKNQASSLQYGQDDEEE